MSNEYTTYQALKPLSSADIASLVAEGRADEIVTKMKAYEEQQVKIKDKTLKLARLTVKLNKADGLYIAHPCMDTMKGGCNFNKHMLPAVIALVSNEDLRTRVINFLSTGETVDTSVILEG